VCGHTQCVLLCEHVYSVVKVVIICTHAHFSMLDYELCNAFVMYFRCHLSEFISSTDLNGV